MYNCAISTMRTEIPDPFLRMRVHTEDLSVFQGWDIQILGPFNGSTTGSFRVSTLESLIRCLGQTVAHRPQLSHLL